MSPKTLPALFVLLAAPLFAAPAPLILDVWPGPAPGETKTLPPEADQTKDTDKLVGGRRIIKLGNVTTPQLAVYRPAKEKDTGAAVVICPGGGFSILAYDLEGTEVAAWLNTLGVTGIVLKYRVPARDRTQPWLAPVQDAQRAMSVVRSRAREWGLDPQRIGILGFSAGGATAGYTSLLLDDRRYAAVDAADQTSCRPDFALLIYTAYFVQRGQTALSLPPGFAITKDAPPMFFVHAFDDGVPVQNALLLAAGYTSLLLDDRRYAALDAADQTSCRPDFALLIYTAYFVQRGQSALTLPPGFAITKDAPPMFFVHAFDDGIPVQNALLLAAELKKVGGSAEVHVYDIGGHGYGLRPVAEQPVTSWPQRATEWLSRRGLLAPAR